MIFSFWITTRKPLKEAESHAMVNCMAIVGDAHMLHGAGIFTYKTGS